MSDSASDFFERMRKLLDAVTSEPKGSYAREEAERLLAQFIQAHHRGPVRQLRIVGGDSDE